MSIEFLSELENKIEALLSSLERMKQENQEINKQFEKNNGRLAEIESENISLKNELETIRSDSQSRQEKMNAAAERIQGLLARLESVQS